MFCCILRALFNFYDACITLHTLFAATTGGPALLCQLPPGHLPHPQRQPHQRRRDEGHPQLLPLLLQQVGGCTNKMDRTGYCAVYKQVQSQRLWTHSWPASAGAAGMLQPQLHMCWVRSLWTNPRQPNHVGDAGKQCVQGVMCTRAAAAAGICAPTATARCCSTCWLTRCTARTSAACR